MEVKYTRAITFSKHTDLLPYWEANRNKYTSATRWMEDKDYYAVKRDVSLILQIRYVNNMPMCRIKCPINPLPIKGEFAVAHLGGLVAWLEKDGWTMNGNHDLFPFK